MDLPQAAGGAQRQQQLLQGSNPYSQSMPQPLTWETLRACLLEEGECISEQDLDAYLVALTGGDASNIPAHQIVDPKFFAEQLLGFEDFTNNAAF